MKRKYRPKTTNRNIIVFKPKLSPQKKHPINGKGNACCFVSNQEKKPAQLSFKSCWAKPLAVSRSIYGDLMVAVCFSNGWLCRNLTITVKFFADPLEHFPPATGRFSSTPNILHTAVSFSQKMNLYIYNPETNEYLLNILRHAAYSKRWQ